MLANRLTRTHSTQSRARYRDATSREVKAAIVELSKRVDADGYVAGNLIPEKLLQGYVLPADVEFEIEPTIRELRKRATLVSRKRKSTSTFSRSSLKAKKQRQRSRDGTLNRCRRRCCNGCRRVRVGWDALTRRYPARQASLQPISSS